MMLAFAALALLAATGLAVPDAEVCNGQGGDSCDAESSDDPSLLAHQIRRVTSKHKNCPGTNTNSGNMITALKYADIEGYDMTDGGIQFGSQEDWGLCAQRCTDTYGCHAWTFVWDTMRCYPKANAEFCSGEMGGPWKEDRSAISGGHNLVYPLNNAESGGTSMAGYPNGFATYDWRGCQTSCAGMSGCISWTFKYSTKTCYVKDKDIQPEPWDYNSDVISDWR